MRVRPAYAAKENKLTQWRSPAGAGELIEFEKTKENNEGAKPVGSGGQKDCRPDWKTNSWQLGRVAKVAPSPGSPVVRVCVTRISDKEKEKNYGECDRCPTRRCERTSHSETDSMPPSRTGARNLWPVMPGCSYPEPHKPALV